MFVQVIQGRATDAMGLRKQLERWNEELRPGAEGYLGTTAGVTEDNEFIAGARFESEEAARRNSDRPEQGEWWSETERYLEDVRFYDCKDVDEYGSPSDDAGFVQVIQDYVTDVERARELGRKMAPSIEKNRPDVLGGYSAWGPDNGVSDFVYFTSEAEARENEAKELPPEAAEAMSEWQKVSQGKTKFIDLKEPWLFS